MSTDSTAEEVNNNLGKSFDWANASNEFKKLMQEVHNIHRRYAAEDVSGSWAKNAVANLFTQFLSTPPVQTAGEQWIGVRNDSTLIRNGLFEKMPSGTINAFDLIKIIQQHLDCLDDFIDSLPQPPTQ